MTTTAINFGANPDAAAELQQQADHNKAMADKFDSRGTTAPVVPPTDPTAGKTPDDATTLIGGEFKTQDELLAAYKALKEGKPAETKPAEAKPAAAPTDPLKIDPATETKVADAGFKMEYLSAEFASNGDLKPETYEKLAKAGIPKEMVQAYAQGQQALASQLRSTLLADSGIGSEYNLKAVFEWAGKNIPAEEVAAINDTFSKGSALQQRLALEAVHARYSRAQGSEPKFVNARAAAPGGDAYQSQAQWKADMRDPRYATDSAFRASVAAKLGRSNI